MQPVGRKYERHRATPNNGTTVQFSKGSKPAQANLNPEKEVLAEKQQNCFRRPSEPQMRKRRTKNKIEGISHPDALDDSDENKVTQ